MAFLLASFSLFLPNARSADVLYNPLPADQMAGSRRSSRRRWARGNRAAAVKAPNHVGYFMKLAREGAYAGTTFHRVIKYGLIQGGDPLSKDPAKSALYGTGGMNMLRPEITPEPMTAGAVGAVLAPGRPTSGGAQFFICASDQLALQGQYTVFGRVVEGIEVVQEISAAKADAQDHPVDRIVIKTVTIRDTPPVIRNPLIDATPAELATYRAIWRRPRVRSSSK
jgi:peptidylprolyl isomerase